MRLPDNLPILQRWCSTDVKRPSLHAPFSARVRAQASSGVRTIDLLIATDGHALCAALEGREGDVASLTDTEIHEALATAPEAIADGAPRYWEAMRPSTDHPAGWIGINAELLARVGDVQEHLARAVKREIRDGISRRKGLSKGQRRSDTELARLEATRESIADGAEPALSAMRVGHVLDAVFFVVRPRFEAVVPNMVFFCAVMPCRL